MSPPDSEASAGATGARAEALESAVRASLYGFLSAGFAAPPQSALVESLRNADVATLLEAGFGGQAAAETARFLDAVAADRGALDLAKSEFMRLFKVPGPAAVPPYESVYDDRQVGGESPSKGLLVGPSVVEVQRWYSLACVEWDASSALDLPHHIAVELKFLTLLCAKEQEFEMRGASGLLTRCREIQRDFLAAHVVSWSARFAERFMERTEHPWIRALGNMLTVFPQRDLESLESTLGRSEGHKVPSYAALPEPGLPAVESATT